MSGEVTATTGDLLRVIRVFHQMSGTTFDDALEKTHLDVARIIAAKAQVIARATGNKGTAKAADSIEARPSNRAALVAQGSKAEGDEWMLGALFGAYPNEERVSPAGRRFKGYNQFPMAKVGGYSVYPAIDAESERTTAIYADAIERIFDAAFK